MAAISGYFLVVGVATVMLGPALPLLAARWAMPDAGLGSLFMAYFAGQFCGSWLATPKLRMSLILGAIVAAFGMFLLAGASAVTAHLALFCAGLGLGAGLTAGNVLVGTLDAGASAQESIQRGSLRSRNLALLNVAWGLGAIACPCCSTPACAFTQFMCNRERSSSSPWPWPWSCARHSWRCF